MFNITYSTLKKFHIFNHTDKKTYLQIFNATHLFVEITSNQYMSFPLIDVLPTNGYFPERNSLGIFQIFNHQKAIILSENLFEKFSSFFGAITSVL